MKPRHPTDPHARRAIRRDAALARLSRLTTATAIAGTVATVGFGGLAAITYSGATPVDAAQQPVAQVDDPDPLGFEFDDDSVVQQPAQPSVTTPPTVAPQYTYVQPPVRTSQRGRVSSGGSG